jgi:hypothetical protein
MTVISSNTGFAERYLRAGVWCIANADSVAGITVVVYPVAIVRKTDYRRANRTTLLWNITVAEATSKASSGKSESEEDGFGQHCDC